MVVRARGQLVGAFADDVNAHLRDALAAAVGGTWETEHRVAGTPVDVAGTLDGRLVLVELEWRRADPADNTAKLFRHLSEGTIDADRVTVCQVFTAYYDLTSDGVSSKRENAEFVGRVAARTFARLSYHPVEFPLDPPKRGAERPDGWRKVADETAGEIVDRL